MSPLFTEEREAKLIDDCCLTQAFIVIAAGFNWIYLLFVHIAFAAGNLDRQIYVKQCAVYIQNHVSRWDIEENIFLWPKFGFNEWFDEIKQGET